MVGLLLVIYFVGMLFAWAANLNITGMISWPFRIFITVVAIVWFLWCYLLAAPGSRPQRKT